MPVNTISPYSKWRNIKNNSYYIVEAVIHDYTNSRDGLLVVLYHSVHDDTIRGVRDIDEFLIKFEKVEE